MLKWFRASKSPLQHTDDPLATIRVLERRPQEIYAVSRINPLFHDGDGEKALKSRPSTRGKRPERSPVPTGKSGSSGYESNLYNSSSECSSGAYSGSGTTLYGGQDAQRTTVLREDAITVLEQNVGFVKSILVAVRGGSPGGTKKKHSRKPSGTSSSATLSPIPEGKIDYCIPRPVWPPSEDNDPVYVAPSSLDPRDDDALLLYTRLTYTPPLPIPRVASKHSHGVLKNTISPRVDHRDSESENMLRELSHTINQALEGKQLISHEDLLKSLSRTINRNLDNFNNSTASTSSEEALKRFSFTLSQSDPLLKMARALSQSSDSSGKSSLRADGRRPLLAGPETGSSSTKTVSSPGTSSDSEAVVRSSSSSSSAASSSGFYECPGRPDLSQPPVFVHQDPGQVSNGARNAMLYGSLCRTNSNHGYKKLLPARHASDSEDSVKKDSGEEKDSSWDTFYGTGVTAGDVRLKSKADDLYHWSPDRPDFTLDIPRAERLMRKIKASKNRRYWCHVMTSLFGLLFFVASVMIVSLMVTRGKRIFGSL